MKKNILAIAIASAVAAPVAMADAPTVYGQFNTAIDSADVAGVTGMNVLNRNSRVGVKGSEDLGNGLKAIYQLELTVEAAGAEGEEVYVDDNGTAKLANVGKNGFGGQRNTFVGVAGGFGTVLMGRHDTPLRMIQPSDGFADSSYAGNNTKKFNGNMGGEDRLNEVVAYLSPDFGGIKLAVATTGDNGQQTAGDDASLTQAMSYSVTYGSKKSGIFAAGAMTTGDNYNDVTRATVQYNEAGLVGSFMYNATADVGTSMTAGVAYKMGALTPRAKVAMVEYENNGGDGMNMAAGVDYHLGKKTRVYAEYAALAEDTGDATVMSVGLFHKF